MGWPSDITTPVVGFSNPATKLSKVDFPHPLAPTIVTNWASSIINETSLNAVMVPWRLGNSLLACRNSILATEGLQSVPAEQPITHQNNALIGQITQQANAEHGGYKHVISVEFI